MGNLSSTSVPTTTGTVSESDGKSVVERYLADINSQNVTDARSIVCASQQANIIAGSGDFSVHVDSSTFDTSSPASTGGLNLTYALTVSANGQSKDIKLAFLVIDESGPKLCGERAVTS
jgi:hypothetical protein